MVIDKVYEAPALKRVKMNLRSDEFDAILKTVEWVVENADSYARSRPYYSILCEFISKANSNGN